MSYLDDASKAGIKRMLAFAESAEVREPAPEEQALRPDKVQACFPSSDGDEEDDTSEVTRFLMEKVEEARGLGATRGTREYLDQL